MKWDLMIANHVCEWVTPLAGVWIEIGADEYMKKVREQVTPLAGVWIEMKIEYIMYDWRGFVTPLAGVWIEMVHLREFCGSGVSLPSRECGLK